MKLIRNAIAAGMTLAAVSLAACAGQPGSTGSGSANGNVGANTGATGSAGQVSMNLTIGTGVNVTSLNWTISNSTNSFPGTVAIGPAQSVEFVAGGITAGSGYVVSLSGVDSNNDVCSGSSAPFTVSAGQVASATVVVTCTVAADSSVAATVTTGSVGVDASVTLVNQSPFGCPGINSFAISPAEILPPQTATLTSSSSTGSGGPETILWSTSCAGATITNPTSAAATFNCGSATGQCSVTLTVGLDGTLPDGGAAGQVCTGSAFTSMSANVVCESGGALACFPPTPTVCPAVGSNPAYCANLTGADPTNCGGCGVVCTSSQVCNTVAGVTACRVPPPTVCTSAPCGANTITCSGNTNGVCSQTEAIFVNLDIANGVVTAPGPDPFTGSTLGCYGCLVANDCLDSVVNHNATGLECDDLTASITNGEGTVVTDQSACLGVVSCISGSTGAGCGTNANGLNFCYCGTGGGPSTTCVSNGSKVNGACLASEANGFTFAQSDSTDILSNFGSRSQPSGVANDIFSCALTNVCTSCLQ